MPKYESWEKSLPFVTFQKNVETKLLCDLYSAEGKGGRSGDFQVNALLVYIFKRLDKIKTVPQNNWVHFHKMRIIRTIIVHDAYKLPRMLFTTKQLMIMSKET